MKPKPRPLPDNVRALRGGDKTYRRKSAGADVEHEYLTRLPHCPPGLGEIAKREFKRAGKIMVKAGMLTAADITALTLYAATYEKWMIARDNIRDLGHIVLSPNGYPMPSPWVAIEKAAAEQLRRWCAEFGLTPASRSGVKLPKNKSKGALSKRRLKRRAGK